MLSSRRLSLALVALAAVVVSAACSSGSSNSGSPGSGQAGAPIKIMTIGVFQSAALSLPDAEAGVKVKTQAVNDAGGINGRKIEVATCNDKFDPNAAASCARQAVSQHVVAVISPYEPFSPQMLPILEAAKIPYIYGTLGATLDGTSPVSFPKDSGTAGQYGSLGLELANSGCKKVGGVVTSSQQTIYGAGWLKRGAQSAGAAYTEIRVGETQADFSAPVAKLLSDGADCIVPVTAPDQGPKVVVAVRQAGQPVRLGAITGEFGAAALQALGTAADGMIITGQEYRPTDIQVPVVAQIVADFAKYSPSVPLNTKYGVSGWAAVEAFRQIAASIDGPVTAASVTAAIQKVTIKTGLYADYSYAATSLDPALPRAKNWGYLVWKVTGGKAVLQSEAFAKPNGL